MNNLDTANTSMSVISADKVQGTKVYNANGDKLGSVETVMIEKLTGQVRYAVLEFGGFLGMGTEQYPIPWDVMKYDTNFGGYVVPLAKEQLETAPHYAKESMPEYTDEYGRKVYDHYQIPWYL